MFLIFLDVSLTVTNSDGSDTKTEVKYITVSNGNTAPSVSFSATTNDPYVGQQIYLTDDSYNNPSSWSWSINPSSYNYIIGTSSSSQNPVIQFNADGQYTIQLDASNNGYQHLAALLRNRPLAEAVNVITSRNARLKPCAAIG